MVGVFVGVGVRVAVGVLVTVGVGVDVGVGVIEGVAVAVAVEVGVAVAPPGVMVAVGCTTAPQVIVRLSFAATPRCVESTRMSDWPNRSRRITVAGLAGAGLAHVKLTCIMTPVYVENGAPVPIEHPALI
jgi:hypothetical protein